MTNPKLRNGMLLALLIAMFIPPVIQVGPMFIGEGSTDAYGTQWFYWFIGHQLDAGEGLLHSEMFFYPWGKDIYAHTGANLLDAVLALPLRSLLGPVLGYNTWVLLGVGLTGLAGARAARALGGDAFVGGILCALAPYALIELAEGRPTQGILLLPTLFIWWMLESRTSSWRAPIAAGIALGLCGLQYWYYALFGGIIALCFGVSQSLAKPRMLGRFALMATVSLIICLPAAWPMLSLVDSGEVPGLLDISSWTFQETLTVTAEGDAVQLMSWQPWTGAGAALSWEAAGDSSLRSSRTLTPLLLWPLVALGWWRMPERRSVGATVLLAAALSIGPVLLISSLHLVNPVYVALTKQIEVMQRLWWPVRMLGLLVPLLAILAAVGVAQFAARYRPLIGIAVLAVLASSARANRLLPFPGWDSEIPAGYQCLAEGPEGAILDLPFHFSQAHLYYQTHHGRPMFGGMLEGREAFAPPEHTALLTDNDFVQWLIAARDPTRERPDINEADRQELGALGYRYVVLQKDAYRHLQGLSRTTGRVQRTLLRLYRRDLQTTLGKPVFEDERLVIYAPWDPTPPCNTAAYGGPQSP